jgi:hypothetical protein
MWCKGDRAPLEDPRPPAQILREDFVRLGPGEFVGFDDNLIDCLERPLGSYPITAEYFPHDLNIHQVTRLAMPRLSF